MPAQPPAHDSYIHTFDYVPSQEEQEQNGLVFAQYLVDLGWSLNAVCGAFGNWQVECVMNTNLPQFSTYPSNVSGGFGLPHWTPWGERYKVWCDERDIENIGADDNPGCWLENQIAYHDWECENGHPGTGGATWYANHGFSYTWEEFKVSADPPDVLAVAYYWQYERSGAMDPGDRGERALTWYEFLTGKVIKRIPIWLLFKLKEVR